MVRMIAIAALVVLANTAWAGEELRREEGKWETLAPMPTPRHDLESVAFNGKIFAVSGAGERTTPVVEVYDPKANKWSAVAPIPVERGWFGAAVLGGKLYCVGGKRVRSESEMKASPDNAQYDLRASVNVYTFADNTWADGPPLCAPRDGMKAVACGNKIYAIAGNGPKDGLRVEVFDPRTNEWSFGVQLPENRCAPGAAVVGGKIYVFGGYGAGGERNDVFIYDPNQGEWTKGKPMPTNRRDLTAVAVGTRIYCLAGVGNGKYINAVEVYDTEKDSWAVAPPLPAAKAWVGACELNGKVYVMGGANYDEAKKTYNWISELQVYAVPAK